MTVDGFTAPVIVCLGPGGVGKTSVSAAIGVALATDGQRVVVLTIDPARRLADAMGLTGGLDNEPQRVEGSWSGELWATMLDPRATFEAVIRQHAPTSERAERILSNRLFNNLTTSLSGTSEYMATERLFALVGDDRFDVVVVDTPPSRHAFDFLDSPGRLTRFVDHPIYRHVLAPRRGVLRAITKANQLAIRAVSKVVGADLLTEVVDFFTLFDRMDQGFRDRAASVDALLTGSDTSYVLVSSARHQAVDEARWIATSLSKRHCSLDLLVINRVIPPHFSPGRQRLSGHDSVGNDSDSDDRLPASVQRNLDDLAAQIAQEQALADELASATGVRARRMLSQLPSPVSSLAGLETLAEQLRRT